MIASGVLLIPWLALSRADCKSTQASGTLLYKSSLAGLSIAYPALWAKYLPPVCGNTYGLTKEDFRKAPIYLVAFKDPRREAKLTVVVYREFAGDMASRVSWYREPKEQSVYCPGQGVRVRRVRQVVSDFAWAGGLRGKKIVTDRRLVSEPDPDGGTGVTYLVIAGSRLVELHGFCLSKDFAESGGTFDRMARSLALFAPILETPQPDTVKRFTGQGFSFEYPGEWIWTSRPWDDEEASARDRGVFAPAPSAYGPGWVCPSIVFGHDPHIYDFLGALATRASGALHAAGVVGVTLNSFQNRIGQKGLKLQATFVLDGKPHITLTTFALPTARGPVKTLTCWCPYDRQHELDEAFNRVAQSFTVE